MPEIDKKNMYFFYNSAYKCLDCIRQPDSCICPGCFEYEKHKGHTFIRQETMGGFCDCGNSNMMNPDTFCSKHAGYKLPHF